MEYTIAIEKDPKSKWYIGQCVVVAGAFSQGRSLEELLSNMEEAITLMVEYKGELFIKEKREQNCILQKDKDIVGSILSYLAKRYRLHWVQYQGRLSPVTDINSEF
ncbi:MAG: type II toxin-antitoxin system HicB family antitoxin [Bacteroidales bacterium]|nr:type II toxin-antitoxin system HicB family antitoxin [Bacteroidales bacterium]